MLNLFKSKYIRKRLFNFLDYKVKLKIVKYNKSLQNLLNLSLFDYIFNGRYIIYETKIKGKEYNFYNSQLIFEGEYLNGKKNGKGKEYDENGNKIFEGEFINDKRNGKWKEYDGEGNLIFKGEYLNGKKMEKEKNTMKMVIYYLRENIKMVIYLKVKDSKEKKILKAIWFGFIMTKHIIWKMEKDLLKNIIKIKI